MKLSQCDRVERFVRANPGASSLEITFATDCVNVTGRVSDLRARGLDVVCRKRADGRDGYVIVDPEPVQVAAFFS